ncbi:MAG: hypothetical protein AAF547_09915 [Actinomycetota bacterium]
MTRLLNWRPVLLGTALIVTLGACSGSEEAEPPPVEETTGDVEARSTLVTEDDLPEVRAASLAFVAAPVDGDLTVTVDPAAPEPLELEVTVVADGDRRRPVEGDGVAVVEYLMTDWDGRIVERSSDRADRLSILIGNPADAPPDAAVLAPDLEQALVGQAVGSRLLIAVPADLTGLPDRLSANRPHVLVIDILAFQVPEGA